MMYNHTLYVLISINCSEIEITSLPLKIKLKTIYCCEQWIVACLYVVIDCAHKGGIHIGFCLISSIVMQK
jgi:hypothetical protein